MTIQNVNEFKNLQGTEHATKSKSYIKRIKVVGLVRSSESEQIRIILNKVKKSKS